MGRAGGNLGPFFTMKITFKGVPGEQHDTIHMYGQDFPLGKAVSVTNPASIRRLENHPHFTSEAEASDVVEDAKIKREFAGAAEAVLAPIEEAKASEPAPAPTPAPTEAPAPDPVHSASEWQDRYEKSPLMAGTVGMPEVVKSAAEYQDLELKGATDGNAAGTGDANPEKAEGARPGRGGKSRRSGNRA